jgi:hypothetical protein
LKKLIGPFCGHVGIVHQSAGVEICLTCKKQKVLPKNQKLEIKLSEELDQVEDKDHLHSSKRCKAPS